ncbi:PLD nuclease N-terminal domain-containing protein [Streptomyces sp. 7-21]|jgi:hypothetical protein|uniref:PLD nuclease N-terminal domain-containing protein n=1 Tax=Streptomyces sp. 7-21 TaxID=2802283 RepID=UPI001F37E4CE|nr:PLD nuclease N-terminal domain-containing protein [Streptomyces sp. 7-21]
MRGPAHNHLGELPMLRVLLFLVPIALAVYALVDCISSKDEEVKHLPKLVWILLIVVAWLIGPLAWIAVGRDRAFPWRVATAGGPGGRGRGGWVAPDDNPEFLRSLERQRREEERRRRAAEPDAGDGSGAGQPDEELPQRDGRDGDEGAGPADPPAKS